MPGGSGFCHEALLYRGRDDLVGQSLDFLRDAIDHDEPALVALDGDKNDVIRDELGPGSRHVVFADMRVVGRNPARIIPVWRKFVDGHPGRRTRGIGEPISPEHDGAVLSECHRHEALLNVALVDSPLWLLCPYDLETLDPAVIEDACSTHPLLRSPDGVVASDAYRPIDVELPFASPLPSPPEGHARIEFGLLDEVRRAVVQEAQAHGMTPDRVDDLVIAANEVATNSLRHGGGAGEIRMWRDPSWVVCEVRDRGLIDAPLVGREAPRADSEGGRGLWMANQLCDLVQLESSAEGTAVRLHMRH